jgi:hypothetical protein
LITTGPNIWSPGAILRRVLELFEPRAAIDARALEPIHLGRNELRGHGRMRIDVPDDGPLAAQRQGKQVARFPGLFGAVEQSSV